MAFRNKLRGIVGSQWQMTDLFDEFKQGEWPRGGLHRYVCHGMPQDVLDSFRDQINSVRDWDSVFGDGARRFRVWADKALDGNDTVLAQRYYLLSAACAFHGQLVPIMDTRRRAELQYMCRVAYRSAAPLLSPKAHYVEVPCGKGELHGFVRLTEDAAGTCVIFPGQASCKEDVHYFTVPLLEHGLNTIAIDFPGTGDALPQLPYRGIDGMWDAVEELNGRSAELGARPLLFLALGAGCAQALRMAAAEPKRVRAIALLSPPHELRSVIDRIRPWAVEELEAFLGCTRDELPDALSRVSCAAAPRKVQTPTLIVGGEVDKDFPRHQSKELAKGFGKRAQAWTFRSGSHGCYERFPKLRTRICQWLAHKVGATHGRADFDSEDSLED